MMRANLHYYRRRVEIWVGMHISLMRVTLAGKLLKLTYKVSPRVIREYEAQVLRTGKGVRF